MTPRRTVTAPARGPGGRPPGQHITIRRMRREAGR